MSLANKAVTTRTSYVRGVRDLMLQMGKLPEECSVNEIIGFLVEVRETKTLSSSSTNLRVCGLKYYYRHVVRRLDLVVDIPNPRIPKYQAEVLRTDELAQLFRACRNVKELLIVQLLFDTGMRSSELLRLKFQDFEKTNRTITLRECKGQKLRVVPYGSHIRATLKEYIKVLGYLPEETIIESNQVKGAPLHMRVLHRMVRGIVKRSGLKKKVSCHTLRHSFAVHFLNNGGHLPQLQTLLGHSQITTTLHYLKYAHIPLKEIKTPLDCLMIP